MLTFSPFQRSMNTMALLASVCLLFAVPTSRALFNLSALFVLLGWFLAGGYGQRWQLLKGHPSTLPLLLLSALILLGALYSPATPEEIWDHYYRYSKFLFVLILISLWHSESWRKRCWWAFVAALLLVVFSTYANIFLQLPWSKSQNQGLGPDHSVFTNHIAQSLVVVFLVVIALVKTGLAQTRWLKAWWVLLAVAAVFSVTHLTASRIGYLTLLAALMVVVALWVPNKKGLLVTVSALAVAASLVYFSSPLLQERISTGLAEWRHYSSDDYLTSVGARLRMWEVSYDLWLQSPIWGHGTGAYHSLSKAAFNDATMCAIACFHPHNQFLFFAVEHGVVGVVVYVWLLYSLVKIVRESSRARKMLVYGFLAILFVDSLTHGPLWLFIEAYFFFVVFALLASGYRSPKAGF